MSKLKNSVEELKALNAKALAKHLRDEFEVASDPEHGRDILLANALALYKDRGIALAGMMQAGSGRTEPGESSTTDQAQPARMSQIMWQSAELVKKGYQIERDEDTGCCWLVGKNKDGTDDRRPTLSELGAFPETKEHPQLAIFRKLQNQQEFEFFVGPPSDRYPEGRRLMMGVELQIHPEEGELAYVEPSVNGWCLIAWREEVLGLPLPHFYVLENAMPGHMDFQDAHPGQPLREVIKRTRKFNMTVFGRVIMDPTNGEVVLRLSEVVVQRVTPAPQEMQHVL